MQPFSPLFPACYNILVGNIRPHILSTHFTSTMTGLTAVSDARLFPSDQEGTLSSSLLEFLRAFLRTMRELKTYQSFYSYLLSLKSRLLEQILHEKFSYAFSDQIPFPKMNYLKGFKLKQCFFILS